MKFAFVFDAGPFRVRKYESVVIGLGTRAEIVGYTTVTDTERGI